MNEYNNVMGFISLECGKLWYKNCCKIFTYWYEYMVSEWVNSTLLSQRSSPSFFLTTFIFLANTVRSIASLRHQCHAMQTTSMVLKTTITVEMESRNQLKTLTFVWMMGQTFSQLPQFEGLNYLAWTRAIWKEPALTEQ